MRCRGQQFDKIAPSRLLYSPGNTSAHATVASSLLHARISRPNTFSSRSAQPHRIPYADTHLGQGHQAADMWMHERVHKGSYASEAHEREAYAWAGTRMGDKTT